MFGEYRGMNVCCGHLLSRIIMTGYISDRIACRIRMDTHQRPATAAPTDTASKGMIQDKPDTTGRAIEFKMWRH